MILYIKYNLRSPVPEYTPFIRACLHFLCSMLNMQQALNSHYHHKTALTLRLSDHPWLSPNVAICSQQADRLRQQAVWGDLDAPSF